MVTVIKRKKRNAEFFYLKHNTRNRQKEIYLGKKIPKDIEQRKESFLLEFYREEWIPKLEKIFANYRDELKRTPKQVIRQNMDAFTITFTYNTQKIEGSTLTFHETANILLHGITPSQKPEDHMIETKLHKDVFNEMLKKKIPLSLRTILYWHSKMFKRTMPKFAGQIRSYSVGVSGSTSKFPYWKDVPQEMKEFFDWYRKNKDKINPVELAGLAHIKFTSIHPFGDGNGRIARLITNYVLNYYRYPLLDIKFADRRPYFKMQEKAQVQKKEIYFLQWFMRYYLKAHLEYFGRE